MVLTVGVSRTLAVPAPNVGNSVGLDACSSAGATRVGIPAGTNTSLCPLLAPSTSARAPSGESRSWPCDANGSVSEADAVRRDKGARVRGRDLGLDERGQTIPDAIAVVRRLRRMNDVGVTEALLRGGVVCTAAAKIVLLAKLVNNIESWQTCSDVLRSVRGTCFTWAQ